MESVPETLENFHTLTRLFVREDFIEFRRRESFKIYTLTAPCESEVSQPQRI
jgi:hypothetical protein